MSPTPATSAQDAVQPPEKVGGVGAIVVAAGQGLRAGQPLPKQFALWRGKPVIRHSVETLVRAGITPVLVVIPEGTEHVATSALAGLEGVHFTNGGDSRQDSVRRGLEALASHAPSQVLIHDAARPALPMPVLERLLEALASQPGAIPVLPVPDSLTHIEIDADMPVMGAPARREDLRRVQTPQAFRFAEILSAHREWDGPLTASDDAQVAQANGLTIALIEGDEALHKLTYAADFATEAPLMRVGTGYDVHALVEGEELWLAGIRIEHTHGLSGHSDADVAIHALVDAMLGAVGAGDIGQHFPPSDPQWRGAASDQFLAHAAKLAGEAGYRLGNADLTIICEAPKIGPHREAMRQRLAAILNVDPVLISVKATTTEKLGFTGRSEGIAAQAAVCMVRS
ncbi:bifunctional 2-C-methyl-D-erythritol 4-phosphate cytidylyltransferase/2-C-methyl-D-erythritol 2,4-cyclodiphosphate synthase [Novosphingobium sp. 9]|uniref:bifunctional 2-C-methyl-D-erythritol 4-phosphate cytidylyltransferase/2-C-methyl-D-erythritol 2,4-cyclodiphosphate synthase n=1 Tax=Novosphingobium sp. 9 TaxID=2025349 RepID=UPI0021B5CFCF|nr:bifunctional 2-C-methyl-D-erythritol 4-phosphate cytidylyltransferase/2-C-methyl-D-erythritol 2,4-cyclodiphosphate synthase [Novosphingobium sp. 9]